METKKSKKEAGYSDEEFGFGTKLEEGEVVLYWRENHGTVCIQVRTRR